MDIELAKKANTSDIPSFDGYVTDEELNTKGYLTSHQDISGKVDKVQGKSLIADTEIERLKSVNNYDDTDIKTELAKKANSTDVTKEISDKIAEVVSDAPESFDTLKEISDWISGHENDASAMNSAIKDNKSAITILQTDKADKTEIPTELPANGGNSLTVNGHTVNSDVPTNAVFTDTVYDDTEVKEDVDILKKATTVNLLNPTLQTTTLNGITCTNNGDGTYTLNGTASDRTVFVFGNTADIIKENANKTLRFVSRGDALETYFVQVYFNNATPARDLGSGITFKVPTNVSETNVAVAITSGTVLPNIIIKPMLTTNLDATYDDFVPYTGDTGRLNGDVASLLKRIEILESLVNKADTTVTE